MSAVAPDRSDYLRLEAILSQCEMALVRRDPVASALLVQAARHGHGHDCGEFIAHAAALARGVDLAGEAAHERAARKVAQALCRAALLSVQGRLLV